ncbi:MAG TPA: hypothetical protein VKH63_21320 [Candidatus Acidoferrum sp.]|nr:hypothetical protein [Candidatus Acidoferrum sp.]
MTKKQKAKIAKICGIIAIVIAALTFILKEIVKENLKDLHDSLTKAEFQFRTESGQTVISLQILVGQEQAELLRIQDEKRAGKDSTPQDFSTLITQDTVRAQEALAEVNSDFDSASRLIDAFPSTAKDLRNLREQVRGPLEKMNTQVRETLKTKPDHDLPRFVAVKFAMISVILQGVSVALLGDAALTAARRVQEASDYLIRICTRAVYCLVLLGFALGLYAAITGIKSESAE